MTKYIRNSGKPWTPENITRLKELAQQNTPTRVIGLKLGRTANAIQTEASKEKISLKPTNQKPYN